MQWPNAGMEEARVARAVCACSGTLKPLKLCQHCLEAFGEQEKEKDCLWCISFAGTPANHIFESSFLRSWSCCSCWQRQEGQEGTKQFPQHCSWVCSILPTLLLQRTTQPNTNNFRTRAAQRNQRKRTFGCELVGDVVSTSSSISYADSQLPVHTQASICTWSAEFEVASNLKTLHVRRCLRKIRHTKRKSWIDADQFILYQYHSASVCGQCEDLWQLCHVE